MLLNEFLKEHRRVEEQDRKIGEQEKRSAELTSAITEQRNDLRSRIAQQQQQIEALTVTLKEQTH